MIISIFNDIIGPVMRGPSSSHCAAAWRIGRLALDLMGYKLKAVRVEFAKNSSLATTYVSHGSDVGLFAGLLGRELDDAELVSSEDLLNKSEITVSFKIINLFDEHPNIYRLFLKSENQEHYLEAISHGGGSIEITRIDDFIVSISGDYYEALFWLENSGQDIKLHLETWKRGSQVDEILLHENRKNNLFLLEAKSSRKPGKELLEGLSQDIQIKEWKILEPVLPVLSGKNITVPFATAREMLSYSGDKEIPLWQLAVQYEKQRAGVNELEVLEKMKKIVRIVRASISSGIAGTDYDDRLLPAQAGKYLEALKSGKLLNLGLQNRVIAYVSALMEVKSSMGVIVAAPTAGACGALPGTVVAVAEELGLSEEEMAKAFLSAGLIGIFIANQATLAAELTGCQAETGAASCMTAAALVTLAGGTLKQSLAAASMALQNMLGLICDPVANRVEVPCLGRNLMAAANALTCANVALAGYDPLIPLDEVIKAAFEVGKQLPRELRCTGLGGLSVTPTSKELERKLDLKKNQRKKFFLNRRKGRRILILSK